MSDTEEDTPREHNEANQENKLHEKKSDTITWKYKIQVFEKLCLKKSFFSEACKMLYLFISSSG